MTNTGGLDITTDGGIDMTNLGGGASEVNVSGGSGEVLDPRTIAAEAAEAAADNFELENEPEEKDVPPLNIIDETNNDPEEEDEEVVEGEEETEVKDKAPAKEPEEKKAEIGRAHV